MGEMREPEGNKTAIEALKETLWVYPKCNCFVYDRACSVVSSASKEDELSQIKYYIIDKFQKRYGCSSKAASPLLCQNGVAR